MTCDVQILRNFDVFSTRDNFELNRTCSEFAQPFEQFCLVPPPSRLAATQTCRPFLNNVLDPSYIFPKTTQGLVVSLEDLPILFVSFPETDSKDVWLRDETTSPNVILNLNEMQYRGFRPVSQASFVVSAAASAVENQVFCLLSNSANSVDIFELYKADSFGMFRTQKDDQGNSIRMRYSSISIQGMPVVACNDDGTIQCACIGNFAYVFHAENNAWTRLESQTGVVTLTVFQNTVVLFLQTMVVFYLPRRIEIQLSGSFMWQCLSLDRKLLFVGTKLGLQQARVFTIDLLTQSLVATATCSVTVAFDTQVYFTAIATESTSTSATILVARGSFQSVVRFVLSNSFQTATQDLPVPLRAIENFYNNQCWFENDKVYRVTSQDGVDKPQGMTAKNFLIPSSDSVWSFVNGKLMRLQAENSWTNDFDLFMGYDARMSDENGVWHFPPSIDPPWYYGFVSQDVPNDATPVPFFVAQSRHNRFRWIADSVDTANNTQFSHLVSHLERINDFYLILNFPSELADDGNLRAFQGNSTLFESNTHDQSSNPNSIVSLDPLGGRAVCTQNGLYLAYVNAQNNARQVVVCYNVFNSSQFADWCANESDEFVSRALQQQSTFCFQNLTYIDSQGTTQFADNRCECLPSTEMFRLRFPNAFSNFESHIATRTIQNIPCLSPACSKVFLLGQENSNVLNYAQSQCKQNLVVGNQNLVIEGQVKMDFLNVYQDCGTGNRCTNNAQCPENSLCFQGNCIAKCTSDDYCKNNLQDPLASCQTATGKCLFGLRQPQTTHSKTYWIVAGAVAILVAVLLLIIMLAILF